MMNTAPRNEVGWSEPRSLYRVAQVRAFDAYAIEVLGVSGFTLMQRAAGAAWGALHCRWPQARRVVVATGSGNNGGDGWLVAGLARAAGLDVSVLCTALPAQLRGDARRAAEEYVAGGGTVLAYPAVSATHVLAGADVVVDALLGTGLHEAVRSPYVEIIAALNASGRAILALDLPSGLNGDTGEVMGAAVRADCTVTFVAAKTGLYLGAGPEHTGQVLLDELQIGPAVAVRDMTGQPVLEVLSERDVRCALPARARQANKGDFGRVLLMGSGPGMPGAVRLAGEACLHCGAGLVTTMTAAENVSSIATGRPELICIGLAVPATASATSDVLAQWAAQLTPALAAASVVAIGPGLGTGEWSRALLDAALSCGKPLVIDADGLNLLAQGLLAQGGRRLAAGTILTPHPGEAARLLGSTSSQIQADRFGALERLVALTGAVVILKGAGTLIGAPGRVAVLCTHGNPGMAAAGMGDVLTGAVAGILAQCRDPWLAARAAVMAHALAGDALARRVGARGILALDLAASLTGWVNGVA